nr:retrovirus-related Pol polyprotein from transposon TNT 1-94 [Tanacetum cinerariifolium]
MLNGSVLSKHFWTDAVTIACYTQNRSIIVKRHDKNSYEIFREIIPYISYFHVFGCPVFIHNDKNHLGKFDAKADDGYFLGYSSVSKAFRVYNIRRQQIEETCHVTFDESMEAIRFTNTLVDEIEIDDSSRYPPDEFQEDDLSRQYEVDYDVSYYIIPHGHSLTEITQENHVPEDIWSRDQHVELVNIIGNPGEGMLTRSMAARNKKDKHVARMEAIRIFLAFVTYINFKVYQMNVKSAFQNGKLKEKLYVKQPPGFESSEFHDYVCKLDKAFYGLNKHEGHVQSKRITSNNYEKNPQTQTMMAVTWTEKALQACQILSGKLFWSTAIAFDPFPSTDKPEKRPLKEFLIKFSVLNGQRPLTLDFNTFYSSTGLNYNNGKYVDHPTPEVLGGNYSSTEQVDSIQQLLAYGFITGTEEDSIPTTASQDPSKVTNIELTAHMIAVNNRKDSVSPPLLVAKLKKAKSQTVTLTLPKSQGLKDLGALSKKSKRPKSKNPPTWTMITLPKPTKCSDKSHSGTRKSEPLPESTATHPKDSRGNKQPLDRDITFTTSDEGTAKTTLRPDGSLGDKDSEGNIPPADMEPIHIPVTDPSGTGAKYHVDETQSTRLSHDLKRFDNTLPLTERQLIKYLRKMSRVLFNRITKKQLEQHEEALVSYADLKASIEEYYEENIVHRDQTDQLIASSMSSLDKNSSSISDLYKGLHVITELFKDINNDVKDDPAINKKIDKAIKTFAKISAQTTEILSLVKTFDFSTLQSTMQDLQAHALKQKEASVAWTKSSTNMAWNLGSRMTAVEISQTAFKHEVSSLSVTLTLALIRISVNVEGENATNTVIEEPPYHTKGETGDTIMAILISSILITKVQSTHDQQTTLIISHHKSSQATLRIVKGKGIATESKEDPSKKLVPISTIIHPDPDEPIRVEFIINGKIDYLIEKKIQEPEVIKVVREEAKKLKIDPKEPISTKYGETSKKAQDAEHEFLKREHSKKVKRLTKLNKRRAKEYMWTMTNRIKTEPITDVRILPNTKPIVASIFRNNDKRKTLTFIAYSSSQTLESLNWMNWVHSYKRKRTPLSKT